jgi:hypothetical protein
LLKAIDPLPFALLIIWEFVPTALFLLYFRHIPYTRLHRCHGCELALYGWCVKPGSGGGNILGDITPHTILPSHVISGNRSTTITVAADGKAMDYGSMSSSSTTSASLLSNVATSSAAGGLTSSTTSVDLEDDGTSGGYCCREDTCSCCLPCLPLLPCCACCPCCGLAPVSAVSTMITAAAAAGAEGGMPRDPNLPLAEAAL